VNSRMPKCAVVFAGLGLISFCLPLVAQPANSTESAGGGAPSAELSSDACAGVTVSSLSLYQAETLNTVDSSALLHELPLVTLVDGRHLPVSGALARMGTRPTDLFPLAMLYVRPVKTRKVNDSPALSAKDSLAEVPIAVANRVFFGGEAGVFYGHATGKYGGDAFATYIEGGVGNDKFQINAGASYEEWNGNGRVPRYGR
jgi:hypothetical protein